MNKKDLLALPAPLQHACPCGAAPGQHCIAKSGKPAREMHKDRLVQICGERFIKQRLSDPKQNKRMVCALKKGHRSKHRNAVGDLRWDRDFILDLELVR